MRPIRITSTGKIAQAPQADQDLIVRAITMIGGSQAGTALVYMDNAATSGREVGTFKAVIGDSKHYEDLNVLLNNGGYVTLGGTGAEVIFWV